MIHLTNDWHKSDMARAVPGAYYDRDMKSWVLAGDVTARAAIVALRLFPALQFTYPELVKLRDDVVKDVRPFDHATPWYRSAGDSPDLLAAPRVRAALAERGWELHRYQEVDLAYGAAVMAQHGAFYLGWERGLGKTIGTCALYEAVDAQTMLVVCPNTAKIPVWASELEWVLPWANVIVLGNTAAQRARGLLAYKASAEAGKHTILVVHYEALAVIAGKGYALRPKYKTLGFPKRLDGTEYRRLDVPEDGVPKRELYRTTLGKGWDALGDFDILATDEDHRLSNTTTQMSKGYARVNARMRLFLSGSIIQNHLEELYSPAHRAFPTRYANKHRDWCDRFLDYVSNGYAKVCIGVKEEREAELRRELGVWMVYRRKEDELDLPELTETELRVELSPGQRRVYDDLVNTCMAELEDGTRLKQAAGAGMLTRLRQVATGLDLVAEGVTDSVKLDLAMDMIRDGEDDDFVVFSWYKSAAYELERRLLDEGTAAFVVTGDTPHPKRADYIGRFQAGEGRVFIGTLATLGESVNLQRANNAIFLDRSFNPQTNIQARDRIYRQGQGRPVTVTHIIAKNTVDELNVLPNLANKEALRAAILGSA